MEISSAIVLKHLGCEVVKGFHGFHLHTNLILLEACCPCRLLSPRAHRSPKTLASSNIDIHIEGECIENMLAGWERIALEILAKGYTGFVRQRKRSYESAHDDQHHSSQQ